MFEELRKTHFVHGSGSNGMRLRSRMVVCLGLLLCKDLQVSLEQGVEAEVPLNNQDLWVVPMRATRDTNIEHVYGVGLKDEDEDSEDEDLDRLGEVASSSSFDLQAQLAPSPPMTQAKSSHSSIPPL